MGKAGRWLRSFLAGKKEGKKDRPQSEAMPATALPGAVPKEKRWSFRRPVLAEKAAETPGQGVFVEAGLGLSASEAEFDQKKHAVAVAVATAAAADAAVAAAQAAAAVVRLSSRKAHLPASLVEEAAAVRIQATFRGYLARTALCALRGIVKLQALVRGQLVRKQANATLRCMQALLTAQSQLRAQRMRFLQEHPHQPPPRPRPSPQHPRHHRSYVGDGQVVRGERQDRRDGQRRACAARRGKGGQAVLRRVLRQVLAGAVGHDGAEPEGVQRALRGPVVRDGAQQPSARVGGLRAVPELHGEHRVVPCQGPVPERAEAAHRHARAAAEEEEGARAEERQDAAVVVAGQRRAAWGPVPVVSGEARRVAQRQRVRVDQLRAHRGHRLQPDAVARRIRGAPGSLLSFLFPPDSRGHNSRRVRGRCDVMLQMLRVWSLVRCSCVC